MIPPLMKQLADMWNSLARWQRASLILVPAICAALAYCLVAWRHDNSFRILYTGLSPEDAAAVTQKMRESAIEYRLDETGASVSVVAEHLADARLALAGAGLPRSGRIGFELFDRNNLGASDFAEQVNYRRALEGELERTVGTLSEVEQARIHITFAKDSVFLEARQPSKATVVLRLRRSTQLSQGSVTAVANLVASAVDGLAPDAVAIIDANGHLLNRPRAQGETEAQLAEASLEYRHQIEQDLLAKINAAIGPLLGPDRFRASVNVDCDFSSTEQSEELMDSSKSALLTSQTTEEIAAGGVTGGPPGSASNLPRPAARVTAGGSGPVRRTENMSYQPSRTVRKTTLPRGNIKRISTAVLVDHTVRWEGTGAKAKKTIVPPAPETLKVVREIVSGVTGFAEDRGDEITVESLPFENTVEAEPPMSDTVAPPAVRGKFDFRQPAVIGAGALSLLLIAGVILFIARGRKAPVTVRDTAPAAVAGGSSHAGGAALAQPGKASPVATEHRTGTAASSLSGMEQQLSDNELQQARVEMESLSRIKLPENTRKTEVLTRHIRESVTKDPTNVTNVLRSWIAEAETRRSA